MTMALLRVRCPSGVSCASGLTGRRAGDLEENDTEPDDGEVAVSIRRGVQELPRRREKDGGAGYSRCGVLPASMWLRTASRLRPGTPHQTCRLSELSRPRGTTPFSEATWSAWRRSKYIVHRLW